ncbi:MAG TPA: hypothetical protein VNC22_03200 [Sporichthya sp.]|nr:hypothetical protein [Sporichthya sp.]
MKAAEKFLTALIVFALNAGLAMLLLGVLHADVDARVPAPGYLQTVAGLFLVNIAGFTWRADSDRG